MIVIWLGFVLQNWWRMNKSNAVLPESSWTEIVWVVLSNRSRIWQIYSPKLVSSISVTTRKELRCGFSVSVKLSSGFWSFSQLKVIGGSPWAEHSRLTRSPSFAFMSPLDILVSTRGLPEQQTIQEIFEYTKNKLSPNKWTTIILLWIMHWFHLDQTCILDYGDFTI